MSFIIEVITVSMITIGFSCCCNWEYFIILSAYYFLKILSHLYYSLICLGLGCFHGWVFVNSTSMNIGVSIIFTTDVFIFLLK